MSGLVNIWSLQDASLLQTQTGPGGVQSLTWVPDVGLAVCFVRSKVQSISLHDEQSINTNFNILAKESGEVYEKKGEVYHG